MLRDSCDALVLDGSREDILSAVQEHTAGLGADVVIVSAPSRQAQEESIRYVRKGGTVSLFASLPKDASDVVLDSRAIHYGELRIVGASDSRPEHVSTALQFMAEGKIEPQTVITQRVSLEDLWEGLNLMKEKQCLKVLVYPRGVEDEA